MWVSMQLVSIVIGTISLLHLNLVHAAAVGASNKATQEGLVQLTAANWTNEISHGAW
jgi:hypothetical protein